MKKGWAIFSTVLAWVLFGGALLGSLIVAIRIRSFIPFLIGVASATVLLCLFGTLGYIAKNVSAPEPVSKDSVAKQETTGHQWSPVSDYQQWLKSYQTSSNEKKEWVCPDCGKRNEWTATECSCGKSRPLE